MNYTWKIAMGSQCQGITVLRLCFGCQPTFCALFQFKSGRLKLNSMQNILKVHSLYKQDKNIVETTSECLIDALDIIMESIPWHYSMQTSSNIEKITIALSMGRHSCLEILNSNPHVYFSTNYSSIVLSEFNL